MTIKSFLVPILALAAFGLPARANVVTYCGGGGCGSNTTSAFDSAVTTDDYTYASVSDLTFSGVVTSSYTDPTTGLIFSASSGSLTIVSGSLEVAAGATLTVSVPSNYNAALLNLSQPSGNAFTFLDVNENTYTYLTPTPQEVGFIPDTTGSLWTITVIPSNSGESIIVNSFDAAGPQQGGADTPEVGTLLLIGAGLIAMRWMRRSRPRFFRTPQTI